MTSKTSRQILASAARTTTQVDRVRDTFDSEYLEVVLDLTVNAGGLGSVTVLIEGYDAGKDGFFTLLQSAALTAVALTRLTVGPGLPVTANISANSPLPDKMRITVTANNANPVTYSLGYSLE